MLDLSGGEDAEGVQHSSGRRQGALVGIEGGQHQHTATLRSYQPPMGFEATKDDVLLRTPLPNHHRIIDAVAAAT